MVNLYIFHTSSLYFMVNPCGTPHLIPWGKPCQTNSWCLGVQVSETTLPGDQSTRFLSEQTSFFFLRPGNDGIKVASGKGSSYLTWVISGWWMDDEWMIYGWLVVIYGWFMVMNGWLIVINGWLVVLKTILETIHDWEWFLHSTYWNGDDWEMVSHLRGDISDADEVLDLLIDNLSENL